jgi:peptidoglycan hydrolase-like protein with peptidoglycan-binding domain
VQLPVIQENINGDPVKAAQTLLGGLTVDGVFGPLTRERTVAYQSEHGLTADGIIGQHTWGTLLGAPQ